MASKSDAPTPPSSPGFLREGWREMGRRRERSKLRKQAQVQAKGRDAALENLGRRAWEQKIDLSASAELRDQLARLETRAGELLATTRRVEEERAALTARQNAETARFDAQRKTVEEKKHPADAALRTARDRRNEQDRAIKRLEARQTSGAATLATLDQKLSAPAATTAADQSAQQSADRAKREQLLLEQKHLTEELTLARESLKPLDAEVQRLSSESQQYDAELAKIDADRKAVLSPIAADLNRLKGEAQATSKQSTSVERERTQLFTKLGGALFERPSAEPALAENLAQIAAIDRTAAAHQSAIDASLALTHSMPPGTMFKFFATVLGVPLLLIVMGVAAWLGVEWWSARHQPPDYEVTETVNPYLSHPLRNHPAYVLANRLKASSDDQLVADRMLDAFRAIHLGVYTPEGKPVLKGAERSDKDFYLYDFHLRILAHAFRQRDLINFDDQSQMFGRVFLGLQDPAKFRPVLSRLLLYRYQQALKQPDAPTSYLILLVDGLARRQVKPYSLEEVSLRPAKDLYLDPLQSFLIMLDTFIDPPQGTVGQTSFPWLSPQWTLFPSVYADAPCSDVKGTESAGLWGATKEYGPSALETGGEIAAADLTKEEAKDIAERVSKVGKGVGTALDVFSGADDLLTLWGINITIRPDPSTIHLRHDSDVRIKFDITVNLDTLTTNDAPIPCGAMAGKKVGTPPNPMKDVELTWNVEPVWPPYLVVPHDMVEKLTGHLGFQTKTDENGKSQFVLEALECPAKQGRIVGQDFMMTASARVLTTKMPSPATGVEGPLAIISLIAKLGPSGLEYLMDGRTGYARFRVEWHKRKPQGGQY